MVSRFALLVLILLFMMQVSGCKSTIPISSNPNNAKNHSGTGEPLKIARNQLLLEKDSKFFKTFSGLLGGKKQSGYSDYQIGTLLLSANSIELDESVKLSPYYLYLVITEVGSNRKQIESAILSFRENFESYGYLYDYGSIPDKTIPFIAPVENENKQLSIENYSVTMARKLQKRYLTVLHDAKASLAIYGSKQELFSNTEVEPNNVFVITLDAYTPDEIANVINKIRHEMTILDQPPTMRLFPGARASEKKLESSDDPTVASTKINHDERFKAIRENEISLIARQAFNAISYWLSGN